MIHPSGDIRYSHYILSGVFSYVTQVVESSIEDTIPAFSNEWTWFYFTQKCQFPVYEEESEVMTVS